MQVLFAPQEAVALAQEKGNAERHQTATTESLSADRPARFPLWLNLFVGGCRGGQDIGDLHAPPDAPSTASGSRSL
jgi:hypothetical protein